MHQISVQIIRLVDDAFPGWVECELVDAHEHRHILRDKVPIFTVERLDAKSKYPRPGAVQCEILDRFRDAKGRELVRVTTQRPWGVASIEGTSDFVLQA